MGFTQVGLQGLNLWKEQHAEQPENLTWQFSCISGHLCLFFCFSLHETGLLTLRKFAWVSLIYVCSHAHVCSHCCTSCPFTPKEKKQTIKLIILLRKRLFPCCLPLICLDSSFIARFCKISLQIGFYNMYQNIHDAILNFSSGSSHLLKRKNMSTPPKPKKKLNKLQAK